MKMPGPWWLIVATSHRGSMLRVCSRVEKPSVEWPAKLLCPNNWFLLTFRIQLSACFEFRRRVVWLMRHGIYQPAKALTIRTDVGLACLLGFDPIRSSACLILDHPSLENPNQYIKHILRTMSFLSQEMKTNFFYQLLLFPSTMPQKKVINPW